MPFYLAPWAMFPVFSLPCRVCLLMSCHLECTRAGSAPSFEGQVPLWGGGLRNILGGAILLWHIFGIPGWPLPCSGLARPLPVEIKCQPGAKGPALTRGGIALLVASLEQELPLSHPPVTGMLVWHVGTRPHVAHRQSFRWADYLDRLSSLNFGPAVLMCLEPFGSGRTTNAAMRWGILHLQTQGVAARLAGTSLAVALFRPHSPHAQTTPACW